MIIIDVETENTGYDIMEHNKRIISIQIGDATKQDLYYDDSPNKATSLEAAKTRINTLLDDGVTISGYNLNGFDIPMLERFLDVKIPKKNTHDLSDSELVRSLCTQNNRRTLRLEQVCSLLKIDSKHKDEMNKKAESYKNRPELIEQAQAAAQDLVHKRGYTPIFAYTYSIDKITGGYAILDSYQDFVSRQGSEKTLFYRYAVGDIISEYALLQASM